MNRIKMRENVLLLFLAAVGATLGISFGTPAKPELLLIVPYLGLGCATLISHHNLMISVLIGFIQAESYASLASLSPPEAASHYHDSHLYHRKARLSLLVVTLGYSLVLLLPCLVALYFSRKAVVGSSLAWVWWVAVGCSIGVPLLLWGAWSKAVVQVVDLGSGSGESACSNWSAARDLAKGCLCRRTQALHRTSTAPCAVAAGELPRRYTAERLSSTR
jgi:hypothetical protein